jgi:hypothetical protein
MSVMGELTFFLGIQIKQTKQGTFVHQVKYTKDLMKKFNMVELKPVSTPMSMATVRDPDENGKAVDQRVYRIMIGSLLYLTVTRPDIQFMMCFCARFQASPSIHISKPFNGSSCISNTHSNLGFGIPLLHHLILLAFPLLILQVVELIEKALLEHVIFLDPLLFVGRLVNNLLLHNPPQRLSM